MNSVNVMAHEFFKHYQTFLQKDPIDDLTRHFCIHRSTSLRNCTRDLEISTEVIEADQIDPFILLTGLKNEQTHNYYQKQSIAASPYLTLLVGQYGTGKTELSYRLCEFVRSATDILQYGILPINLSFCRESRNLLDVEPNSYQFGELLFTEVQNQLTSKQSAWNVSIEDIQYSIQQGDIFLLLDALDEFVDDPIQHRNFFAGLRNFLFDRQDTEYSQHKFRVLVTMRREYLSAIGDLDLEEALSNFASPSDKVNAYMIELDHFSDWEIKRYLLKRLPNFPELFSRIEEQGQLLSTLRRPLLLKLFADVVIQKQKEQGYHGKQDIDMNALLGITEAAQLIGTYVDLMTEYVNSAHTYAKQEQNKLNVTYIWNNDQLAMRSVELYKKGTNVLSETDIEQIREFASYGSKSTDRQDPFLSIYKCPFLLRVDKYNVRFAHRIFLEYFTARGLVMEAEQHFDKSDAFNTLVLSTDMRKFLKFMVNTNKKIQKICTQRNLEMSDMDIMPFHIITRRSYGLLDHDEWSIPNDKLIVLLEKLDEVRILLLNGMTDPEEESKQVENNIEWFLENEGIGLHPKYLMYCHEGTAAYLYQRRWSGRLKPQSIIFNNILHSRIQKVIKELQNPQTDQELVTPLQLLAERIFDIAFRLRYGWVVSYAEDKNRWQVGQWDTDSEQRIDKILQAVRQIIF